jgi:hypothetical protein
MLIEQRPFKTKIEHYICPYHQAYPETTNYAGCTCGSNYSQIPLTDDEIEKKIGKIANDPMFGENIREALPILKELAVRFKKAWTALAGN